MIMNENKVKLSLAGLHTSAGDENKLTNFSIMCVIKQQLYKYC